MTKTMFEWLPKLTKKERMHIGYWIRGVAHGDDPPAELWEIAHYTQDELEKKALKYYDGRPITNFRSRATFLLLFRYLPSSSREKEIES